MDQQIASKNRQTLFAGVRSLGNAEVARILGCSEPTVSELGAEAKYKFNFNSASELISRMGLKLVPADRTCYRQDYIDHLMFFAKQGMNNMSRETLEWED
jgi:DNA-binding CsgD family transcriptional regulator